MKNILLLSLLFVVLASCNKDDDNIQGEFEFIKKYSTKVTVGGVVGVIDRTFEIGEVYPGIDEGMETIKIRIPEHTELDKDCHNSACYQELLKVPREYLKRVE